MSKHLLKKWYNGHMLYRNIRDPYYLTLLTNGYGSLIADALSGYSGSIVHLTATPSAGYALSNYECTGSEMTGNNVMFTNEDVTVKANFDRIKYTLTLQTDGHGTLAASKTTGYAGDTVTLTPTNNTYYRFNNYQCTGGSIVGNTFTFGAQNATAKANFNTNTVTASGTWVFSNDNDRRNNAYFIGWPKINASNNTSAISALRYASASQAGTSESTISRTLVTSFSIPTGYSSMSFTSQTWPLALTGGGVSDYTWYLTATLLQSGDGNHQISTKEISVQNARTILFLPNANGNYKGSYYITGHRQTTYGMYENQNAKWGLTAIAP